MLSQVLIDTFPDPLAWLSWYSEEASSGERVLKTVIHQNANPMTSLFQLRSSLDFSQLWETSKFQGQGPQMSWSCLPPPPRWPALLGANPLDILVAETHCLFAPHLLTYS